MGLISWIKGLRSPTFKLLHDDIVVFVVGPSGSGKSLFVTDATKIDLIVLGANLQPRTTKVQAIRCELTEAAKTALGGAMQKNIVFVDTPSFHTGHDDRVAPEKEMESWLSKAKCQSTLIGTIYVHRVETDPRYEPIHPHLDAFAHSFPQGFPYFRWREQLRGLPPSLGGKPTWVTSLHPDIFRPGDPETVWQADSS
ncbi:hypothetical protein V8E55_009240 [Tylopilus felleus]